MEQLEAIDRELFLLLNGMHNAMSDWVMYWVSEKQVWLPLYLLLIWKLFKLYPRKAFITSLIFAGLVVFLCDRISVMMFKDVFLRYRPCHNEDIQFLTHIVNGHCGGLYGFISSHASNHFGIAVFAGRILSSKPWLWGLLVWASVIAYSRIYLGVHYPSDVAVGALLGSSIGYAVSRSYFVAIERFKAESI